jgi:acyl-coenzyme A synthetase/AMP-(fatty) acid ligase
MRTKIRFGSGPKTISDGQIENLTKTYRQEFTDAGTAAVFAASPIAFAVSVLAARETDTELVVIPSAETIDPDMEILQKLDVGLVITGCSSDYASLILERPTRRATPPVVGGILIFTSGTSGAPKLAKHTWKSIEQSSKLVPSRLSASDWYLAYEPASYAGIQVFLSAINSGNTLIVPKTRDIAGQIKTLLSTSPDVISATPTWWRLIIGSWPTDCARISLRQATLGGEVVTQNDLDAVKSFFSPTHVTHIYASTEAGTAIVVSDGLAGFPAHWLDAARPSRIKVVDGVLHVQSEQRMLGYVSESKAESQDDWINTQDMVEIRGDRCYLLGRADGLINVGGRKIRPEEIENAILAVKGVIDSLVYAKKNPVTGSLLAADIAIRQDVEFTIAHMKEQLLDALPDYKVPSFIRFVDKISVSSNDKKMRRDE